MINMALFVCRKKSVYEKNTKGIMVVYSIQIIMMKRRRIIMEKRKKRRLHVMIMAVICIGCLLFTTGCSACRKCGENSCTACVGAGIGCLKCIQCSGCPDFCGGFLGIE